MITHSLSPEKIKFRPHQFSHLEFDYVWEINGSETYTSMSEECLTADPEGAAIHHIQKLKSEIMRFGFGHLPVDQLAFLEENYPVLYEHRDSVIGAAFEVEGLHTVKIMNYVIAYEVDDDLNLVSENSVREMLSFRNNEVLELPLGLYSAKPIYSWLFLD